MTTTNQDKKRELAEARKILDIADMRQYDMPALFKYDLIPSRYRFDSCCLMEKPDKSELTRELEKKYLKEDDYTQLHVEGDTAYASAVDLVHFRILYTNKITLQTIGSNIFHLLYLLNLWINSYNIYPSLDGVSV